MKKVYTTPEYKYRHKQRGLKILRQRQQHNQPERKKIDSNNKHEQFSVTTKSTVLAPSDFRLLENTEFVVSFFQCLRSEYFTSHKGPTRYVKMSLKHITKIDYAAISILTAIGDDLKYKRVLLLGDLPQDNDCRKFMIESGYLNNLYDEHRRKFAPAPKSEMIFFEKGCGILSAAENKKMSELVKNAVNHLTGESRHFQPVKSIILEICGNSIEWSGTENKQWLLGVKYEVNRVVFTVSDVGRGILDTLYRKPNLRLKDLFSAKGDDGILKGAFDQKYGSRTLEINRNKGLPSVKTNFVQGTILSLKVITNNVILHFDDDKRSRVFKARSDRFKGTFYQWEMTNDCLNKIIIE